VPAARVPDESIGEFWVDNPWKIKSQGENLSAFERNRLFLNLGGGGFVDVSGVSGADSDGDGRAVIGLDADRDGRQDLLVRQAGGGPLLLFMNRIPAPPAGAHWLSVRLRGGSGPGRSNSLGIGARVVAHLAGGRQIVRELHPINTHVSQAPAEVHLGLGASKIVERLTVRWPSGRVTKLNDVAVDRVLTLEEPVQEK
jgi:hypothetical protein